MCITIHISLSQLPLVNMILFYIVEYNTEFYLTSAAVRHILNEVLAESDIDIAAMLESVEVLFSTTCNDLFISQNHFMKI
jgi:hypothetical protein